MRRLCALVGVETLVGPDVVDARALWRRAALVAVDPAVAAELVSVRPPRRDGVLLVTSGPVPASAWPLALALGADAVLALPEDEAELLRRVDAARVSTSASRLVGVTALSSAAGASTLAAAVAVAARGDGVAVALVDVDPAGGGVDVLVGAEDAPGPRWPQLLAGATSDPAVLRDGDGAASPGRLYDRLPAAGGIRLLSASRDADADLTPADVAGALDVLRGECGVVVVDAGRPGRLALTALQRCDRVLGIVAARVPAAAAARVALRRLRRAGVDVELVVRTDRADLVKPAEVARALGLPLAAVCRTDPALLAAAERGALLDALERGAVVRDLGALVETATRAA